MTCLTYSRLLPLVLLAFLFSAFQLRAQQPPSQKKFIYVFKISDEIAKPVWYKTRKALKEASALKADIILIHMNTYGGLLDMADSIRTAILNNKIPVWVFIDNNAASAGALISIACDSIYMRQGANIGAATVVNQTGEQLPDKYQSYMRALMRSTAQANGRNPDIAQAMVDPRIHVEGVNDSGQVVTFTAQEALKHGYCNAMAENIPEVLKKAGIVNYTIHEQQLTATDKMIGFLIKPAVAGILIMIIIAGIYFEFQSPGIGFPLVMAIIAALLYFAPHYLQGLAANWEILVFVAGVLLLAVEIFVIPGFGVAGILGIFMMVMGLTLAMIDNLYFEFSPSATVKLAEAFFIVVIAFFASITGSIYITRKIFTGKTFFGDLALVTTQQKNEGFTSADTSYKEITGKTGLAHTMLRPAGKVMIDGILYDATALTGYIDKGEPVEVVKYETAQLFVKKLKISN
ncbi:MAG: NfeD family protein [Bacteroidales bacterium]|nr:NfeD family protein [Bacteroidales bacterium]